MELIADRIEVGLGGSSLRLVYVYFLYRAFLAPTCVVLDRYSQGYIRLVYAIGIRLQIYTRLLPTTATAARALSTISICLVCAFSITNLVLPSWGQGQGSGLYTSISICFFQVYIKYMLTIVVPKGARVSGTGHLHIIKVCNCKIAYSKRRQSICQSEIKILMLPQPDVSIYSTYSWRMLWCYGEVLVRPLLLWICDACAWAMF